MERETIPFPPDADYPHHGNALNVLRIDGSKGRYAGELFTLRIGDVGGQYDSLTDQRNITLTRKQIADLARHLVGLLAAQP